MLRKQWDGFCGDKAEKSKHNADPHHELRDTDLVVLDELVLLPKASHMLACPGASH